MPLSSTPPDVSDRPGAATSSFVHLHVHTEYSMLDGAARIDDLMSEAVRQGMPAIATTDHGYIFGAYEFWKAGRRHGIKPIIGLEAYVTPGTSRFDRTRVKWGPGGRDDVSGGGAFTHMTLLARTTGGMHNLFRLASLASLEGHYFKPRMDRELLSTYADGLIATTGCPSGEVQTRIRLGQYEQARQAAADLRDIFGAENFYCELMDHGLGIERQVQRDLLRLADDLGLPLVATNDLHYTRAEDAKSHAALLCVQSGSTLADPNRFKFDADDFYLKTAAEMRHTWRELPQACDNTLAIAERCEVTFSEGEGRYMPRFDCPPGENEESWFVKEVERGLNRRFPGGVPDYARKQAAYEIEVIAGKGYCFPPETPVLLADGRWKQIGDVVVGDEVTSVSSYDFRSRRATVEKVLSREVDEELTVIRPFGQVSGIRATDEHPFLVASRGWVAAKDVRAGDEVLLPQPVRAVYEPFDLESVAIRKGWLLEHHEDGRFSRLATSEQRAPRAVHGHMATKVEWSPDLMWLMGLWVAEGHVISTDAAHSPGQVGWTLHKDEPAVGQLCEVIERLGLGTPRVYSKASACAPHHQGVTVMLTNHPLALFLTETLGSGVRLKQLHPWVSSVPDEGVRAFIAGWHQGDGHTKQNGRQLVSTVNPTLARQLRSQLLSLGQWATITGGPGTSQRAFKVTWTPSSTRAAYNARCVDGRWWVRVRSVERQKYTGSVHNLTVSGDHTYVADGVAVHNCGYFLVVADFINWAKDNGIRVGPGRGSGAGSMAAYAMGITDLDPVPHGLIFERFLNPERPSMPDFDVDFDERRRGEVIRYVTDKYGEDRVAQIVTYGTIKAKQALKDASRVMGFPFAMGEKLTKAMPPAVMGKDIPLSGIFDPNHKRYSEAGEFRALHDADPDAREVVKTARGLEGLKRQWGVHAAGVIMSSEPLIDLVPIMRREQDGQIITQLDYPSCEALGLVKMDFLGLRNLTILDDAVANVRVNRDIELDLDALSKDMTDPATFALLASGDTLGVFQLDGGGMRTLLRLMQPDHFEDISAALALYRPGPMGANSHTNYALRKAGKQEITPIHPELAEALQPILSMTQGLIVYQEQVQQIAQKVAGYTLGKADLLRRAMGKKKKSVLDAEFVPFSEGMRANGYSDAAISTLWDILVPFSDYAFNKAHTAAYGLVSYWTAYLKANFPAEYMAALLTSVRDDKDKSALYLNECRRMGIKVLPPDVNESIANFAAVGTDIRFGLAAVRNVGAHVVEAVVEARESLGRFASFDDFLRKVPAVVCNKRTIESLIKAGAFDSLGHPRAGLVRVHEVYVDSLVDEKRKQAQGQDSLFGGFEGQAAVQLAVLPAIPEVEWEKKEKLKFEREMLGLYVSDHPLFGIEHVLASAADCPIAAVLTDESRPDGSTVTVAGMISGLQRKMTKNGNPWAIATVEDLEGAIEVLFFPGVYQTVSTMLTEDLVVVVRGRLSRRDEVPTIFASEMTIPDLTEGPRGPVVIAMPLTRCTPPVAERLKDVLATHPGITEVHLRLTQSGRTTVMRLDDRLRVTAGPELFSDLKALLGPGCLAS
jgi:DNA polymerase III alpha subunit